MVGPHMALSLIHKEDHVRWGKREYMPGGWDDHRW
jgi:hypothetical protein